MWSVDATQKTLSVLARRPRRDRLFDQPTVLSV
jgi:hypothetical protein